MNKIKKGDIVGRKSYGKDIIFVVERIIKTKERQEIAILKGLTIRIQADSLISDLDLIEPKKVEEHVRSLEEKVTKRIQKIEKMNKQNYLFREKMIIYTGRILHIDGDRRYSEKSKKYYKKIGLNAVVKNIPERRQYMEVTNLVKKYNPDILVITRS